LANCLAAVLGHFPKSAPLFQRFKQFIDRLLPLSHFIPLAGHLAIARLDLRISHSGRGTVTLVRLLPIDVGSVPHDAFSGYCWRVMQRGLTTGRNEHIQIEEPQEASVAYGCAKRRSFA
jgi:hypothetical protein